MLASGCVKFVARHRSESFLGCQGSVNFGMWVVESCGGRGSALCAPCTLAQTPGSRSGWGLCLARPAPQRRHGSRTSPLRAVPNTCSWRRRTCRPGWGHGCYAACQRITPGTQDVRRNCFGMLSGIQFVTLPGTAHPITVFQLRKRLTLEPD